MIEIIESVALIQDDPRVREGHEGLSSSIQAGLQCLGVFHMPVDLEVTFWLDSVLRDTGRLGWHPCEFEIKS